MPFCQQSNTSIDEIQNKYNKGALSGQLTEQQVNNTRLVTKCRFIIENKIGEVKKNLSLDHVRNTQMGHIAIDYRIACAMNNFQHKCIVSDVGNEKEIANRIRKRLVIVGNQLEYLLIKHLSGSSLFDRSDLKYIQDFPRLSQNKLVRHVF